MLLAAGPALRLASQLAGFAAASPALVGLEWGCDALIVLGLGARLLARDRRALLRSLYLFSLLGVALGALYAARVAFLPAIPQALISMHFELAAAITLLLLLGARLEGRLNELMPRAPARERAARIAPIQHLALDLCAWLDVGALLVAIAAFITWLVAGPVPRLGAASLAAGATLLVQRSCTLRHGVWWAMRLGTSRPSREGVLVREPAVLEAIGTMRTLLLDERGLSEGRPREVVAAAGNLQRDGVRIMLEGAGPCNTLQRDLALCEYDAASAAAPGSVRLVAAEPETGSAIELARDAPAAGGAGAAAAASVSLTGPLAALARARAVSRATLRVIRRNLALSGTLDVLALLLAAGTLHALIGWTLGPLLAAALLSASAAGVLGNLLHLARAP